MSIALHAAELDTREHSLQLAGGTAGWAVWGAWRASACTMVGSAVGQNSACVNLWAGCLRQLGQVYQHTCWHTYGNGSSQVLLKPCYKAALECQWLQVQRMLPLQTLRGLSALFARATPLVQIVSCCATARPRSLSPSSRHKDISACVCSRLQLAPLMISVIQIDILLLSAGLPHEHQRLQNAAGHKGVPKSGRALEGPDHTHQVGHGEECGQERGGAEQKQIQGARWDLLLHQVCDCAAA